MKRRTVWITGGGTGIGKALAGALYRQGHRVVISGRRADVLEEAAQDILSGAAGVATPPGDLWALPGDVSDPAYVAQTVTLVRQKWGDIDVLINNAAVNFHHTFQEAPAEEFIETFRINCLAAIYGIQAVLPSMLARKEGAIVNVSSILGKWASASSSAYSLTKYALAGLTDSLRQELAASGVHVMGVYPGFILTPMTVPFVPPGSRRRQFGRSPEAMAQAILRGLERRKREVLFPWYVPWVLRLHSWFPGWLEKFRHLFSR